MTKIKDDLDIYKLISEYIEYSYNECPDSFIIVKDGIEMTASDWCQYFGGTPKGQTNHEFLRAQFKKGNVLNNHVNKNSRDYDD